MEKNERGGLRTILVTLAGSNTAAYIAGRYADRLLPDVAFDEWIKLAIVVGLVIVTYVGAYKLIERIIERKHDREHDGAKSDREILQPIVSTPPVSHRDPSYFVPPHFVNATAGT